MASRVPRILVISEIPTPYRLPLYERLAARPEIELEVVFCSRSEPDRPWDLDEALARVPHRFLAGVSPAIRTRKGTFVYELNPGAVPLAARGGYDVAVVGGYAVFAEQVTMLLSRLRRIPYVLHSESTLAAARPRYVRLAKRAWSDAPSAVPPPGSRRHRGCALPDPLRACARADPDRSQHDRRRRIRPGRRRSSSALERDPGGPRACPSGTRSSPAGSSRTRASST